MNTCLARVVATSCCSKPPLAGHIIATRLWQACASMSEVAKPYPSITMQMPGPETLSAGGTSGKCQA